MAKHTTAVLAAVSVLVIGGVALVADLAGISTTPAGAATPSAAPGPPTAAVAATLERIASATSSANGDSNPTEITAVGTTRQAAQDADGGAIVDTDQPVYLIHVRGQFIGYEASVPYPAALPRGTTLTIVVDAATMQVTDWGIDSKDVNLDAVGPAVTLGRG